MYCFTTKGDFFTFMKYSQDPKRSLQIPPACESEAELLTNKVRLRRKTSGASKKCWLQSSSPLFGHVPSEVLCGKLVGLMENRDSTTHKAPINNQGLINGLLTINNH
jgi:hypothetical protein